MLRYRAPRVCGLHQRFFSVKSGKRPARPEEAQFIKHVGSLSDLHPKHPKTVAQKVASASSKHSPGSARPIHRISKYDPINIPAPSVKSQASYNPEASALMINRIAALKAKLASPTSHSAQTPKSIISAKSGSHNNHSASSKTSQAEWLAIRRAKRFLRAPKPAHDHVPTDAKPLNLSNQIKQHFTGNSNENIPALVEPVRIVMTRPGHFRADQLNLANHYTTVPEIVSGVHHRYVRPSADIQLVESAAKQSLSFVASTSSTTGPLGHFYNAFLGHPDLDLSSLTEPFQSFRWHGSPGARAPVLLAFRKRVVRDGKLVERTQSLSELADHQPLPVKQPGDRVVWAVDRVTAPAGSFNILASLGHVIERQFVNDTASPPPKQLPNGELLYEANSYRYTSTNNFLVRAQLDSSYADGTTGKLGVYDLKSRAVAPIRYNMERYLDYQLYELSFDTGMKRSFELEYYDLARICFMKFNLQCRLGHQQGVFMVYHNTKSHLGFQKITCEEMERVLCGVNSEILAPRAYDACLKLYGEITDRAVEIVRAVHSQNEPESFRLGIASSPISPFNVSIFVHAEVSIDAQFDADRPVTHRQVILDYCDSLSVDGIKELAQAHEIELRAVDMIDRLTMVAALENGLANKLTVNLPPLKHFVSLAKSKHLVKFDLHIYHQLDGKIVNHLPWNAMTQQQVQAVQSHYTINDAVEGEVSDEQALIIAKEYYAVMITSRFDNDDPSFVFDDADDHPGLSPKERVARLDTMSKVGSTSHDYHPYIHDPNLAARMRFNAYDRLRRDKLQYAAQRHSTSLMSKLPGVQTPAMH